jgi:hypothetical protein
MSVLHRRLEPGADITPLTVQELDYAHEYCRAQVKALLVSQPRLDDHGLKEHILNDANCPELIQRISLDRPSFFDLLCSKTRYRTDLFDLQRKLLLSMENKTMPEAEAFQALFKTLIPNSNTILRDLEAQARAAANGGNIQ